MREACCQPLPPSLPPVSHTHFPTLAPTRSQTVLSSLSHIHFSQMLTVLCSFSHCCRPTHTRACPPPFAHNQVLPGGQWSPGRLPPAPVASYPACSLVQSLHPPGFPTQDLRHQLFPLARGLSPIHLSLPLLAINS